MADEQQTDVAPKNPDKIEFKKPVLFGRIGKLPKKAKVETEQPSDVTKTEDVVENTSETTSQNPLPPAESLRKIPPPVPYKEPKWSGMCPDGSDYALEVVKSGVILDKVALTNKPYYVFGRVTNCDVLLEHPTSSRYHAILQYKAFATEGEPPSGWYLFDLGSTHGTFLNKDKLKQQHYTRVRVGHQIKFGTSSRVYIMLGPDFDCEGESELTVTEIQQKAQLMKLERDRMIKEAIEQREKDRLEEERKKEEHGIDWGMGEDAEEEPDLADNPYAVAANEELYLDDPKKTLRGYFEREGHELTYDCEERGVGQFMCRVELPIDDARGQPVVAEVVHRGKKKEAVVACALEACRVLDRAGLLRQAKHESRRRKQRDWSAEDYYDSDDDTFLDRTGSVEDKRRGRMRRARDLPDKPLTYDDLLKQISELEQKISSEEKVLEELRARRHPADGTADGKSDGTADALDEFMHTLKHGTMGNKADISKAKMNIMKLKTELSKTQRLAELARPAHAPPILKKDDKRMAVKQTNSVVYGKRIRLKEDIERKSKPKQEVKKEETEFVEEMDSDEEDNKQTDKQSIENKDSAESSRSKNVEVSKVPKMEVDETEVSKVEKIKEEKSEVIKKSTKEDKQYSEKDKNVEDSTESKRVFGPMRPPENYVVPENYFDQETDRDLPEIEEKDDV